MVVMLIYKWDIMIYMYNDLIDELNQVGDPDKARHHSRFFKTGKEEYGEGDVFLGIKMPVQRSIAKKYTKMSFCDVQKLLDSRIHEHRMTGLIILVNKFKKADDEGKKQVYEFYMQNLRSVNNWDLVDVTCPNIVGAFLFDKDKSVLYELAKSEDLWEKRIAIISTMYFIKYGQFEDTLRISKILLEDTHDLIHKAVGWMLREVGKKDQSVEEDFLMQHCKRMPRTMLRYAIERFEENKRKHYLNVLSKD